MRQPKAAIRRWSAVFTSTVKKLRPNSSDTDVAESLKPVVAPLLEVDSLIRTIEGAKLFVDSKVPAILAKLVAAQYQLLPAATPTARAWLLATISAVYDCLVTVQCQLWNDTSRAAFKRMMDQCLSQGADGRPGTLPVVDWYRSAGIEQHIRPHYSSIECFMESNHGCGVSSPSLVGLSKILVPSLWLQQCDSCNCHAVGMYALASTQLHHVSDSMHSHLLVLQMNGQKKVLTARVTYNVLFFLQSSWTTSSSSAKWCLPLRQATKKQRHA